MAKSIAKRAESKGAMDSKDIETKNTKTSTTKSAKSVKSTKDSTQESKKTATKTTAKSTKTATKTATKEAVNTSPKVGIVIPIYNTPLQYFKESIESVLAQDYKDFELLIVHDGDFEPCVQMALEYAKKDARISVIVKPLNEGVSIARNIAIEYFSKNYTFIESGTEEGIVRYSVANENPFGIGVVYKKSSSLIAQQLNPLDIDYIHFLDSDDTCVPNFLSECVLNAKNAEVLLFNFNTNIEQGAESLGAHIRNLDFISEHKIISQVEWLEHALETKCLSIIFVWQAFIDFRFLLDTKLRFLNQVMREDNLFGALLLLRSNRICTLPKNLINYRIRSGGETNYATNKEGIFLPGFLRPLFDAFGQNLVLTKHFYVSASWFIQKLYLLDYVKDYVNIPNINQLVNGLMGRLRSESLRFIHSEITINPDAYFNICFKIYLALIDELPNYNPHFRPFDKIAQYIANDDGKKQEVSLLLREILAFENNIIVEKNKTIADLMQRIQELEGKKGNLS